MSNALAATDQNFQTEVLDSSLPVLVDFWATWCGPCRQIAPIVEELAGDYAGRLKVTKVDVDSNPGIAAKYRIRGIPSLFLFKGGEKVDEIIGLVPKQQIIKKIESVLESRGAGLA